MNLKRWIFRAAAVAMCLCDAAVYAQECVTDTTAVSEVINPKYERRLAKREMMWKRLLPNLFTLQYAGGIGMFSTGFGWDYGRSQQWETHMLIGFVPKRYEYPAYATFTLRETYVPWKVRINGCWSVKPFTVSLSLNSIFSGDFWTSEPERYPKGYYGFSSRLRFHLGFGQRVTFTVPEGKRRLGQQFTLYYEISTCDLYVRQKILSSKVPLKDIIILGIGVIYTI